MRQDFEGFTLKHRVFLVKNYYQFTGDYLCVKTKYDDNYKNHVDSPDFSFDVLMEIINLFERTGSVFKGSEVATTAEGSSQQIEQIYVKEEKLPESSSRGKSRDLAEDPITWDDSNDFPQDDGIEAEASKVGKHSCEICGEEFRGTEALMKHQKTHMKEANFQCNYKKCKKSFKWWTEFNEHRQSHSDAPEKKTRNTVCSSCGDNFNQKSIQDLQCSNCSRRELDEDDDDDRMEDDAAGSSEDAPEVEPAISQLLDDPPNFSIAPKQTRDKDIVDIRSDIRNIFRQMAELKAIVLGGEVKDEDEASLQPRKEDEATDSTSQTFKSIFPLKSLDAMFKLEKNLEDDQELLTQLVGELSRICGHSGKYLGNGRLCAYTLVDVFFTRHLLNNFTWTGSCRGTCTKRALRDFKNILGLFFTLINRADRTFTMNDLGSFFKCILKNAKKRSVDGINHRASAPKRRKFRKFNKHSLEIGIDVQDSN